MADVDIKTPMGPHNAHPVPPPTSPKKRSFEEIENSEVKPDVEPPPASALPVKPDGGSLGGNTETPAASETLSIPNTASVENTMAAITVPNTSVTPVPAPTPISPPKLPAASGHIPDSAPSAAPVTPNKKVKLTPAEKKAKEKQKAEEKVRKEEEKRIKEEEKKKRDEEREQKRKLKEQEKQAKEEERKKKEEEKTKKERSQMRLNAFFAKPLNATNQSRTDNTANSTGKSDELNATSENKPCEKQQLSDYQQEFPPFFLQSHVKLGPPHRFHRDSGGLHHAREKIDKNLRADDSGPPQSFNPAGTFRIMPYKRRQGRSNGPTVREVLVSMQDPSLNQIDLTGDRGTLKPTSRLEDALRKVPMKMLKFGQDVRPPYRGTFSKRLPEQAAVKLCRNPFARAIDDLNYDYDSEAEWEEPEEGENLSSEGEDDATEDGEDDMDDFLDDAEDEIKRKTIASDLEPVCSGIRWDDGRCADPALSCFKMEVISETLKFPIDPFSDVYWKPAGTSQPSNSPFKVPNHPSDTRSNSTTSKQPQQPPQPNPPSSSLSKSSAATPGTGPSGLKFIVNGNATSANGQMPRILLPPDQLTEFKDLVSGSDLTKAGLVEVLKKRFPKVSKDAIKETLAAVAVRRGQKEVDKRWVLT